MGGHNLGSAEYGTPETQLTNLKSPKFVKRRTSKDRLNGFKSPRTPSAQLLGPKPPELLVESRARSNSPRCEGYRTPDSLEKQSPKLHVGSKARSKSPRLEGSRSPVCSDRESRKVTRQVGYSSVVIESSLGGKTDPLSSIQTRGSQTRSASPTYEGCKTPNSSERQSQKSTRQTRFSPVVKKSIPERKAESSSRVIREKELDEDALSIQKQKTPSQDDYLSAMQTRGSRMRSKSPRLEGSRTPGSSERPSRKLTRQVSYSPAVRRSSPEEKDESYSRVIREKKSDEKDLTIQKEKTRSEDHLSAMQTRGSRKRSKSPRYEGYITSDSSERLSRKLTQQVRHSPAVKKSKPGEKTERSSKIVKQKGSDEEGITTDGQRTRSEDNLSAMRTRGSRTRSKSPRYEGHVTPDSLESQSLKLNRQVENSPAVNKSKPEEKAEISSRAIRKSELDEDALTTKRLRTRSQDYVSFVRTRSQNSVATDLENDQHDQCTMSSSSQDHTHMESRQGIVTRTSSRLRENSLENDEELRRSKRSKVMDTSERTEENGKPVSSLGNSEELDKSEESKDMDTSEDSEQNTVPVSTIRKSQRLVSSRKVSLFSVISY